MGRFAALMTMLVLAGCGGTSWNKDGATSAATAKDLAECNSMAESASETQNKINQDILSVRGKDWQDTGNLQSMQDGYRASLQTKSTDIVFRCMVAKGYAPRS